MKRLLFISAIFVVSVGCRSWAISFSASQSCNQSSASTLTCTASMTFSSGDFAVLYVGENGSVFTNTVSDTCNHTWTHQPVASFAQGTTVMIDAWTVSNAVAGSCSITVTRSNNAGTRFQWVAATYSGVWTFGNMASGGNAASRSCSISLTTQNSNNFVVAGFANAAAETYTATAGTLRVQDQNVGGGSALSDNTASTPSSVVNTVSQSLDAPCAKGAIELVGSGPPGYPQSSTTTANAGTISAIFTSSTTVDPTGKIWTCSPSNQCLNTVAYDTSINPTIGVDPYTRVTDGSTSSVPCGVPGDSRQETSSGGDNDNMWSLGDDYLAVMTTGSQVCILQLDLTATAVQVKNPVSGPTVSGGFSFSRIADNTFYYKSSSNYTAIYQGTISSTTPTYTTKLLKDVGDAGVCPGLPQPFVAKSSSILNVSQDDDKFTFALSDTTGGQNTAVWVVTWSRTLGCSTVNYHTGEVWSYCTASCSPTSPSPGMFSTGCWGADPTTKHAIHDVLMSYDGNYAYVTIEPNWLDGICATLPTDAHGYAVWQINTLGNQYCDGRVPPTGTGCVDHSSVGYSQAASNDYAGPLLRPNSSVTSITQFAPAYSPKLEDWHSAWPDPLSNGTYPLLVASDLVSTANSSGCSSAVYCPIYQHNEIFAIPTTPPYQAFHRFGHTFSCGQPLGANCTSGPDAYFRAQQSIMACSQDGKFCALTSSMFCSLGLDSSGVCREDVFVIRLM